MRETRVFVSAADGFVVADVTAAAAAAVVAVHFAAAAATAQ